MSMKRNMIIAARMNQLITLGRYSQRSFAEKIGVSKSSIGPWLNGEVESMKIETLYKICDAFNVSLEWLLGEGTSVEEINKRRRINRVLDLLDPNQLDQVLESVSKTAYTNLKENKLININYGYEQFFKSTEQEGADKYVELMEKFLTERRQKQEEKKEDEEEQIKLF